MSGNTQPRPVEELSYEEALNELQQVVRSLERGDLGLENSLAAWERGEALGARCREWLDNARSRIESKTKGETAAF